MGGVGAASIGAGFGTSAYFSDGETFEENSLAAGELDLRIDWQQLYWGMPDDHPLAPYGSAGRPFVSAHPDDGVVEEAGEIVEDHRNTGEQSLNSNEFETVPDDGIVRYSDEDANTQEYLTCESLANWEPADFDNDNENYDPEALIDLEDVKPGDRGEITFSLHLCDNPGYVWIGGEQGELDTPLADAIWVQAWYDIECDNEFAKDAGDKRIVGTPSSLRRFLEDLDRGHQLNPKAYPHVDGIEAGDEQDEPASALAGTIYWTEAGLELSADTDGAVDVTGTDPLEYTATLEADGDTMVIRLFELVLDDYTIATTEDDDLSRVQQFDWEIIDEHDGAVTDVAGVYELEIESQGGDVCDCYVSPCADDGHVWPFTGDTIASTKWSYCKAEPELCFPAEDTFCVAFEWVLPTTVGNEVQRQAASWDLSFYTEQCRHNPYPDGP